VSGAIADHELRAGAFEASSNRTRLDLPLVHELLRTRYWAQEITLQQVERQTAFSTLAFGLYQIEALPELPPPSSRHHLPPDRVETFPLLRETYPRQVGFCRVVSDLTRFAYLADVVVAPQLQGRGLGKLLLDCVYSHPELVDVRLHCLRTDDAHTLYQQFGFRALGRAYMWMEKRKPAGRWR
jgi:GNAT superfamily N-acetyltransferase